MKQFQANGTLLTIGERWLFSSDNHGMIVEVLNSGRDGYPFVRCLQIVDQAPIGWYVGLEQDTTIGWVSFWTKLEGQNRSEE